jgi:uncharacterized protein (TIRG00374 family)
MNKKAISILTYIVTLGLGVFLIAWSLNGLNDDDLTKIKYAVSKARFELLIPILIMGFISHWSRAVRWRYLMEPLGIKPKISNTFFAVMIGYLANMAFPRLGEVMKCTLLARYEKVPADKLIGTIIAERLFDVICLLLIFLITFLVQIDFAYELLHKIQNKPEAANTNSSGTMPWILGILLLGIAILFIFRHRIAALPAWQRIRQTAKNMLSGLMSFRTMEHKGGFLLHTAIIWTMYLSMIVLGFQSIRETAGLAWEAGLSVLSFGSVGMIATPGGLGAYTGLVEKIISLYGIEKAICVAISWVIWLVPTCIIILGGAASFLLLPFFNRKKNDETR